MRDEVTGEKRKLCNEEFNDLYSLFNIIRVIKSRTVRWAGHVARIEESRVVYRVLVGNPKGKRPHGRPSCRWEHKIKLKFQEVRLEAWIGLLWLRIGTGGGYL